MENQVEFVVKPKKRKQVQEEEWVKAKPAPSKTQDNFMSKSQVNKSHRPVSAKRQSLCAPKQKPLLKRKRRKYKQPSATNRMSKVKQPENQNNEVIDLEQKRRAKSFLKSMQEERE